MTTRKRSLLKDTWLSKLATGEEKISEAPDLVGQNSYPFRLNPVNDNTQIVISA